LESAGMPESRGAPWLLFSEAPVPHLFSDSVDRLYASSTADLTAFCGPYCIAYLWQ
jgi:hypothetical protein